MNTVRSHDGTPIAFDRVGEGPPLIVVGGALGTRSSDASLAALLAPHATVIAYDRRGRGDSGDTPPYAVEREVEDLGVLNWCCQVARLAATDLARQRRGAAGRA